jgi:hypothetical protein
LAAQGRAVAAREAAAARARAAAAEQLHNPTGAIGLGARNVQARAVTAPWRVNVAV